MIDYEQAQSMVQIVVFCQINYDMGVGSEQTKWFGGGRGKDISVKHKR